MSRYASRCNECGRSTTLSAFFQVGSLAVLIVAILMVGGVLPMTTLGSVLPRGWFDGDSPLPERKAAAEASVAAGGGGQGSGRVFGYGASGDAPITEQARGEGGSEEGPTVSEKGASRDPACNSEGAIRRLAERHPDWDRYDLGLIACDRVRLGFTDAQVQASLGRPLRRQTAPGSAAEVWIYRNIRVVLERDRVVSIRE
ncbi:MAG TPA: hypothetical protein VFT04_09875 [Gemmatimonadales bacterium]|nr:hypothetical protein [Gemmatimonadales bacterium]